MSSSPVSQNLQITAPQIEAKPQQRNASQDGQFHDLLARASSTVKGDAVEGEPKQGSETASLQQSDERLKDHSEQDASPQYDDASTNSDALSDAPTEIPEVQEDDQSDAIELSEAAQLVLAAQVSPEEILSAEGTTEPALEATLIDVPSVENFENQGESEPQASTEQFAKTLELNLPANQYDQVANEAAGAIEQAAVVELPQETDSPAQKSLELPASAQLVDSAEQPAQTIAAEEHSQPATAQESATKTEVAEAEGSGAVGAEGSVADVAEGSVAVETETLKESNDRKTSSHKPKVARESESAADRPDAIVETEAQLHAGKKTSPVPSGPSSPAVVNPASGEATAAPSDSPNGPTGGGSNIDADLVPTIDRARFVQRVSRAFQSAQAGKGEIQLRLSPPELGSLRISITVHEGVVSAKVEAETAAARNILLDNLPALRERLADQEISIEKFDVDVRRDGGQEAGNSGADDREARQTRANSTPSQREASQLKTTSSLRPANPRDTITNDGLDVRI